MESIRAEIKAGFDSVHRRIDDKHEEVMRQLETVADKQDETSKLVHQHSGVIDTIRQEIASLRDRWHRRFNELQATLGLKAKDKDGELAPLTRLDAKTAAAIFVAGGAALMALLKLMGKV